MAENRSAGPAVGLPVLNVALLGECGVGKTSLIRRFKYNAYIENVSCDTVGEFEDVTHTVPLHDNLEQYMTIRLHDTAGMEAGGVNLTSNFYRNKDGIILTWDITREETYRRLEVWEDQINNHYQDHNMPAFIVVANKAENQGMENRTYQQCLEDYRRKKVSCFRTSAVTGLNVTPAFVELIFQMGRIYRDRSTPRSETSQSVNLMNSELPDHPGRGECCNK